MHSKTSPEKCEKDIFEEYYLVIPSGTIPEKAGNTGIIPKDLIRSNILNCRNKRYNI